MLPIIYQPLKQAKRIKVFIPYELIEIRNAVKKMDGSFWHPHQKLWSVINTDKNFKSLKKICDGKYNLEKDIRFTPVPKVSLNEEALEALFELEKALVLKQYTDSSIKVYKKRKNCDF